MFAAPETPLHTVWQGVKTAWAIVLGPVLALMLGGTLGAFAAGDWVLLASPAALGPMTALILPVEMLTYGVGALCALLAFGGMVTFWMDPDKRFEGWWCTMVAAAIHAFLFLRQAFSGWQVVRAVVVALILVALLVCVRKYPAWSYRRKLRQFKRR
ncbi:MAG: hypothetical protein ACYS8X_04520 [Planctomycetota bacterium]|jgi:DMSO/TMAO reductase YedYZ heme-binding membrane subunit